MKLPLPLFLALRYLRPQRTFVSAIMLLSVLGVTLAVMVLIVVLSVMAGFEKDLREKIIGFNAEMVLSNGGVLTNLPTWTNFLHRQREVAGAAPYVMGPVVVNYHDTIFTPILRGIDPQAEETVLPIRRYVVAGDAELVGESVLVGKEWAMRNGVFVGDKIQVYAPRQLASLRQGGSGNRSIVLPTELLVTGIFQTGYYSYDHNFMITSLENAQYLYNIGEGVHGVAIRLKDPRQAGALKKRWNDQLAEPVRVQTWMDQNESLFTAIATEKVSMACVLFFIMVVAAFGLCSTLITVTVQKTREIGVLKSLGATDGQVRGIFLLHGWMVGLLGSGLGVGSALIILVYRNDFRQFLSDRFHLNVFASDIYGFVQLPAEISPGLMVWVALSAVLICMAASLIPAQGAASLSPVRALRHE